MLGKHWFRLSVRYYSVTKVGFVHTESGLPRRAAICARGGKAFELYYVRLHHPRQAEGGLTRRTSLDRGGQQTFVFWDRFARRAVRNGGRIHLKINWKSAGVRVLVRYRSPGVQEPCEKSFSLISCIHHRLLFLLQLSANRSRSSSSSELDIMN